MIKLVIGHNWDGSVLDESNPACIEVKWLSNGDLSIQIDAPFANDPKPICQTASCWALWNYEVVELFLVGEGAPVPYTEIEISPWAHYLVLQLRGQRHIANEHLPLKKLSVERGIDRWMAQAVLAKKFLPEGNLTVNAYRLSGAEPNRQYHVMTPMTGPEPDFHLIDQFNTVLKR